MAGGEDHPRRPHCDHDTQMHRLKASTMVPARISRRRLMCDTPGNQAYKGHYSPTLDMHLNGAVNTKTTETRSSRFVLKCFGSSSIFGWVSQTSLSAGFHDVFAARVREQRGLRPMENPLLQRLCSASSDCSTIPREKK